MTFVKICGITNLEDALAAAELGADALGFVFISGSPRYIGDRDDLPEILAQLPRTVARVAVCSGPTLPYPTPRDFNAIQYYDLKAPRPAGLATIGGCRLGSTPAASDEALGASTDALLLDAYHKHFLGGTGTPCDWNQAADIRKRSHKPVLLAGGLTPENVAAAIAVVRPAGVDVSSGVEAYPGRKDFDRMRAFLSAVRTQDRTWGDAPDHDECPFGRPPRRRSSVI